MLTPPCCFSNPFFLFGISLFCLFKLMQQHFQTKPDLYNTIKHYKHISYFIFITLHFSCINSSRIGKFRISWIQELRNSQTQLHLGVRDKGKGISDEGMGITDIG